MNNDLCTGGDGDAAGDTLSHFESVLASRTKVPPHRLGEYLSWSGEELKQEIQAVNDILKRFAQAVANAMEDPTSTHEFLRNLDLKTISHDHDWRAIFSTIRAQDDGDEGYSRAVLIKYLQFLSFRKRLFEFVYSKKANLSETGAYSDATLYPMPDEPSKQGIRNLLRLPLGEAVELEVCEGKEVPVILGRHSFRLTGRNPPCLVDGMGTSYPLGRGRKMVGRHPASDVVICAEYPLVSRAHLIIESDGRSKLTLTDLSSGGTFVTAECLRGPAAALGQPGPNFG